MARRSFALALLLFALAPAADAATLRVGPGERFATPSAAAAAARAGDRIVIRPGRYRDCAVWRAADLVIEAEGGEAVIFGPVCQGKALFVVAAPRITITGLAFEGAVGPSGNGAGIRAEGGDLTIRRVRFENNQTSILTALSIPTATVIIEDSLFRGQGAALPNGTCLAHGIYANPLALLAIRRARFEETRTCHHIKSRAARTEITDTLILDGAETTTSYLVDIPNGGDVLLARSTLRKGPNTGNPGAAVVIGAEGVRHPTASIVIEGNRFENRLPRGTAFVRNLTDTPAALSGNTFSGRVIPLEGPGAMR
jgi:hypothetical protein